MYIKKYNTFGTQHWPYRQAQILPYLWEDCTLHVKFGPPALDCMMHLGPI